MDFKDIKDRHSVLKAVREFDQPGRADFLKRYKFGEARRYFLLDAGEH